MTNADTFRMSQKGLNLAIQTLSCLTDGVLAEMDLRDLAAAMALDSEMSDWFSKQLREAFAILLPLTKFHLDTVANQPAWVREFHLEHSLASVRFDLKPIPS